MPRTSRTGFITILDFINIVLVTLLLDSTNLFTILMSFGLTVLDLSNYLEAQDLLPWILCTIELVNLLLDLMTCLQFGYLLDCFGFYLQVGSKRLQWRGKLKKINIYRINIRLLSVAINYT